jgi:LysR family hydrogen peroxide-inducible transcriptional activator
VVHQANLLKETVLTQKNALSGTLNLAVIPTVAPYLLPQFIASFTADYPHIVLKVSEMHTHTVLEKLRLDEIDMAILSTPLNVPNMLEVPLYYERFAAYISPNESIYERTELSATDMPLDRLWVLEEGHCLRNQVFNFCDEKPVHHSTYEAGSIDTLVKIVDKNGGYTVIPELHVELLTANQQHNLRQITKPEATREISVIIRSDFVREGMLNAVAECVKKIIPAHMLDARLKKYAIRL